MLVFKTALPIPPSVNNLFPTGKGKRRFISPAYKAWREEVSGILKGCRLNLTRCNVIYTFYPKNKTFGDTENYLKAVSDALVEHGVIQDDKHTCLLKGSFEVGGYDPQEPRVEVEIYADTL